MSLSFRPFVATIEKMIPFRFHIEKILCLYHKAVHGPFTPEPKYAGSLADEPFTLPDSSEFHSNNLQNWPRWLLDQRNSWHGMDFPVHTGNSAENFYKSYCEALSSVDDSIGTVMEQLKKMGIEDKTLVAPAHGRAKLSSPRPRRRNPLA